MSDYKRLEAGGLAEAAPCERRNLNRAIFPFFCLLLVCVFTWFSFPMLELTNRMPLPTDPPVECTTALPKTTTESSEPTVFVITPTFARPERFADMTRLTQTLMHVSNLFWIVVEDGNKTSPIVERMLDRSGIKHVYLNTTNTSKLPRRGWAQRNFALEYLRKNYANDERGGVVYFADDDNSYDIRLFDEYIRKVTTIGLWAVGLSGMAKVESPHVENGVITKWDVIYNPRRKFATDMAGFAVHIGMILNSNASFGKQCIGKDPENCFLQQFNLPASEAEPFGFDAEPKEVLVWHTKTAAASARGDAHGYAFENRPPKPTKKAAAKPAEKKPAGGKPAEPKPVEKKAADSKPPAPKAAPPKSPPKSPPSPPEAGEKPKPAAPPQPPKDKPNSKPAA
ncbi:Galactosylgalactosylxylosylprotein 3-beta-glucuronosyltransferase [Aphelenchoides fujianensis]|nr:Galactosylgalactosylxylosylprotein 3-beta-glucuronosyltransferase [Aphelenchoides fujianensis]